jgi:hypothetical protein
MQLTGYDDCLSGHSLRFVEHWDAQRVCILLRTPKTSLYPSSCRTQVKGWPCRTLFSFATQGRVRD